MFAIFYIILYLCYILFILYCHLCQLSNKLSFFLQMAYYSVFSFFFMVLLCLVKYLLGQFGNFTHNLIQCSISKKIGNGTVNFQESGGNRMPSWKTGSLRDPPTKPTRKILKYYMLGNHFQRYFRSTVTLIRQEKSLPQGIFLTIKNTNIYILQFVLFYLGGKIR